MIIPLRKNKPEVALTMGITPDRAQEIHDHVSKFYAKEYARIISSGESGVCSPPNQFVDAMGVAKNLKEQIYASFCCGIAMYSCQEAMRKHGIKIYRL